MLAKFTRGFASGTLIKTNAKKQISRLGAGPTQDTEPEVLVPVEATGELIYGPQVLPGGNAVLFTVRDGRSTWDEAQIVTHSLETGERKVLFEGGRDARYLPSGHLVYVLDGTLFAVPFAVGCEIVLDGASVSGGHTGMFPGPQVGAAGEMDRYAQR